MTVYIETLRNVPVLLWILIASSVLSSVLPSPRQASTYLGGVVPTNRGFYIPAPTFESGAGLLLLIFLASLAAIWWFGRWAKARAGGNGEYPSYFLDQTCNLLFARAVYVFCTRQTNWFGYSRIERV